MGEAAYVSTTDPRTLVGIDSWETVDETEDNDSPVNSQEFYLDLDANERAVEVHGTLQGIGWSDLSQGPAIDAEGCNERSYQRVYKEPGDYLQDLDFFVVEAVHSGLLCLRLFSETESKIGWDLVGYLLDECDVPIEPVTEGDEILGFGNPWPSGGWSMMVEQGARIGVLVAGYSPNDPEHVEEYSLGLSLLHSDGSSPVQICPFNPSEAEG
jgi:hypothetical protein